MLQLRSQVAESQAMLEAMMSQMAKFTEQVKGQEDAYQGDHFAHHPVGMAQDAQVNSFSQQQPAALQSNPLNTSDFEHPLSASYDSTQLKTTAPPPQDPIFERFARTVFRQADRDCDGFLSPPEFGHVLSADVLNVTLDPEEANELFRSADTSRAGKLSFEEFCPPFRTLLQRAYQGDEHEEWVQVGFSGTSDDALPVYASNTSSTIHCTMLRVFPLLDISIGEPVK